MAHPFMIGMFVFGTSLSAQAGPMSVLEGSGVGMVASVRAKKCRDLTERLLRDPNSVSKEELNTLMKP